MEGHQHLRHNLCLEMWIIVTAKEAKFRPKMRRSQSKVMQEQAFSTDIRLSQEMTFP